MSPPMLMVAASLLFATMGACVKFASSHYSAGEIVFYRGMMGALIMGLLMRARGETLRTGVPLMHAWRSIAGVSALGLWFYTIGALPLATAVTLNYTSPIWVALLMVGGSVLRRHDLISLRLLCAVLAGFAGVLCVLQPVLAQNQLWDGLAGLLSGMLAALAYLQVSALGKAGEPEGRVVFYFSVGSIVAGCAVVTLVGSWHDHTVQGAWALAGAGISATLAQLLMTRAYRMGNTLATAVLQYLGIVWSFLYGVLLFGDPVHGVALVGMGLITVAGIAAVRAPVAKGDKRRHGGSRSKKM